MPNPNLEPRTTWEFPGRSVGRRVLLFDRLDSTNTLALTLATDRSHDGLAVLARDQTAGRGQHGRTWQAPAGSSVLLSLILFPPGAVRRPALLTAWAAVSVCELIRRLTGLQPGIKWPNDVLVAGKKICGILIEQRHDGPTVVGVGLNVRQPDSLFAEADLPDAGSLFSMSGQLLDSEQVALDLLVQLDENYCHLLEGNSQLLESSWKQHLGLLGEHVVAELADREVEGHLRELGFAGLVLETPAGELFHVVPEMVRHVRDKSAV